MPTIEVITLTSDSTQGSPLKLYTSNIKFDFVVTSPESPDIPPFQSKLSTPKIDKDVKKIQQLHTTPTSSNSPIEYQTAPSDETQRKECAAISIKQGQDIQTATTSETFTKQQAVEDKPKPTKDHDKNEEDQMGMQSPGKSSISDIKRSNFYEVFQE